MGRQLCERGTSMIRKKGHQLRHQWGEQYSELSSRIHPSRDCIRKWTFYSPLNHSSAEAYSLPLLFSECLVFVHPVGFSTYTAEDRAKKSVLGKINQPLYMFALSIDN